MNKRLINITLLLIVLISLISFSANAAFADIFRAGLTPIEDFFSGGWQNYEKTVAFVVFFFLFFTAYLIGMKNAKVFGDKLTRVHIAFAFVAAFLSSLIITVNIGLEWINIKYIAWVLLAILIFFMMYALLSKLLGKHKFWAFILALILTALLLWLIWYLMHEGRPLENWGRISDAFAKLGKGGGKGGGKAEPWPEGAPITSKPKETVTQVTQPQKGWLGRYGLILLLLIPALVGEEVWRRRRRGRGPGEGPPGGGDGGGGGGGLGGGKPPEKIEDIEQVLLELLNKLINIQELIMNGFKEKIKHGIILTKEESKGYNFPDSDVTWFYKEENKGNTIRILQEINKLFDYNKRLVDELNAGLKLDAKEIEVLKYLAQELQKEEDVLWAVTGYYKGDYYERDLQNPNKPRYPLAREHYKGFEVRGELNENLKSEIIIADEEMKKYLRQMLAPVLVRLYQLFTEFREAITLEQNTALNPLNDTATRLLKEQNGEIKLEGGIKKELDSNRQKFVALVKDKEFVIYKNLEKDHDDKEEAKRDLKKGIWKREKLKEEEKEEKEKKKEGEEGKKEAEEKEKKSAKGEIIKPVKEPRFSSTESDMIGRAVSTNPNSYGISKDILDETYRDILLRSREIESKGLTQNAEQIRVKDNLFPKGNNKYIPRSARNLNPYRGRNLIEVVRYIGEVYYPLKTNWNNNVERIKERIRIVKKVGKEKSIFTQKEYKRREVFTSPLHASSLYDDIKEEGRNATVIENMKNMDRSWQVWWNMFVLGVWQFDRLIRTLDRVVQEQGKEKLIGEVIPVKVRRVPPEPPFHDPGGGAG